MPIKLHNKYTMICTENRVIPAPSLLCFFFFFFLFSSPLLSTFIFPLLLYFPYSPPLSLISLPIPSLISLLLLFSSSFPFSSLSLFPSSLPFSFVSLFLSSTLFSFYFQTLVELLLYHLSLLLPFLFLSLSLSFLLNS